MNDLMLDHDATKIVAVGMSGYGKTQFANKFILESRYDYYFVFDYDGQFAQRNGLKPAFTAAQILHQLKTTRFVVFNPTEFPDPYPELKSVKIVEKLFEWFCRYVYKISEGLCNPPKRKLLYCDDIQDVVDTNRMLEFTSKVVLSGRNRGLDFICTSLQYNMIHNTIRGQATQTVAFGTDEQLALKDLVARGFKAEEIRSLQKGQFVLRNKTKNSEVRGEIFKYDPNFSN
jgi:hypothetical protein